MSGGSKLALCVALMCSIGYASAADIVGKASVIGGDTIEIHGQRIRLWGIDALNPISFAGATTASITNAVGWLRMR